MLLLPVRRPYTTLLKVFTREGQSETVGDIDDYLAASSLKSYA